MLILNQTEAGLHALNDSVTEHESISVLQKDTSREMKYIEEIPAADPDQSDHSLPLQVMNFASVLDPGIPPPDLSQEILSSRSLSFEDMEALTSIVPDTTEPHQTMIVRNKMHSLPLHKPGL